MTVIVVGYVSGWKLIKEEYKNQFENFHSGKFL